ncbi:MAG: hypothetical protein LLG37_06890 [Spirochaetia bacterium]|nr:hypothetical protein [Spirochaetia bacterium]
MKKVFLFFVFVLVLCPAGYCDEAEDLAAQIQAITNPTTATASAAVPSAASGLTGGFSIAALFGGLLFGTLGIYVFGRGKKRQNAWLMVTGVLMIVFPYFIREAFIIFLIGALLCGVFYWKRNG